VPVAGRTELERNLRDVLTRSVLLAPRPGETQLAVGDELLDDPAHNGDGASRHRVPPDSLELAGRTFAWRAAVDVCYGSLADITAR
jgi:hypothetical protein